MALACSIRFRHVSTVRRLPSGGTQQKLQAMLQSLETINTSVSPLPMSVSTSRMVGIVCSQPIPAQTSWGYDDLPMTANDHTCLRTPTESRPW